MTAQARRTAHDAAQLPDLPDALQRLTAGRCPERGPGQEQPVAPKRQAVRVHHHLTALPHHRRPGERSRPRSNRARAQHRRQHADHESNHTPARDSHAAYSGMFPCLRLGPATRLV